jgi:hypothetical protein
VKAKIDNIKTKIQDEEDRGPRSRPTLARHHASDQLAASLTSSPQEGSPPRSLRLAREVSTSHELPPTPTEVWAMTRSASLVHERLHHDAWGNDSPHHANALAGGPCKQLAPPRALMRVCPAVQPSHQHHLQLCHTQASPEALKHPLRRAQA